MPKPNVRVVLLNEAKAIESDNVAVLLSAGIDSASCMFALLETNKQIRAYSFVLDGRMSTDYLGAFTNAKKFGVPFHSVLLPSDVGTLQNDILRLHTLGARLKTEYECMWPMLYAYDAITEDAIFSGLGADGHFCLSKKGMIHYRDDIDAFRKGLYDNPKYAQAELHQALASQHNKKTYIPYLVDAMKKEFLGTTWNEVNRPRQKQPILNAFPDEFRLIKVRPHTNFHLGDSGISNHFKLLLNTDWNTNNHKSVVGIFNDVNRWNA